MKIVFFFFFLAVSIITHAQWEEVTNFPKWYRSAGSLTVVDIDTVVIGNVAGLFTTYNDGESW